MINANKIAFTYDKKKEFIKDLTFNIEKGKITTILGPNGSGKSTVLSLLCGLNKISDGEIIINDKNINNMKYRDIAKEIATVHQQNTVPDDITVKELIAYGRMPHKKYFQKNVKEDEEIVQWAIERTGLAKLQHKEVMSMSGGERQRSKILFLDEPTTYLDIYHQIELLELIKELKEEDGLTIVMVLHDINQALTYSDNIMVMKNGQLIKIGKASEVISMNLLNDVYNIGGFLSNQKDNVYFVPMKREKNCV